MLADLNMNTITVTTCESRKNCCFFASNTPDEDSPWTTPYSQGRWSHESFGSTWWLDGGNMQKDRSLSGHRFNISMFLAYLWTCWAFIFPWHQMPFWCFDWHLKKSLIDFAANLVCKIYRVLRRVNPRIDQSSTIWGSFETLLSSGWLLSLSPFLLGQGLTNHIPTWSNT